MIAGANSGGANPSGDGMVGRHVVTLDDVSTAQIRELLHKAQYIDAHRKEVAHTCEGRVLATLFYEPSTRKANP